MRVELTIGNGAKSEIIVQGDYTFIDIAKICKEFLDSDKGYRLEIYRSWNISARTVKGKFRKRYMTGLIRCVVNVIY